MNLQWIRTTYPIKPRFPDPSCPLSRLLDVMSDGLSDEETERIQERIRRAREWEFFANFRPMPLLERP